MPVPPARPCPCAVHAAGSDRAGAAGAGRLPPGVPPVPIAALPPLPAPCRCRRCRLRALPPDPLLSTHRRCRPRTRTARAGRSHRRLRVIAGRSRARSRTANSECSRRERDRACRGIAKRRRHVYLAHGTVLMRRASRVSVRDSVAEPGHTPARARRTAPRLSRIAALVASIVMGLDAATVQHAASTDIQVFATPVAEIALVTPLKFVGDERALVEALRSGHPGAVAVLYERHAAAVHRTLRSALGPDADLPDLVQEVFIRALDSIAQLDDHERLRSWLGEHRGVHRARADPAPRAPQVAEHVLAATHRAHRARPAQLRSALRVARGVRAAGSAAGR